MKLPHSWIIYVLLAAFCQNVNGAEQLHQTRSITVDDGLSQNHPTAIAQDQDGLIWIGTAIGLNRYDGYRFEKYLHTESDDNSIAGSTIHNLHIDQRGNLWVGTEKGLDRYLPESDSFQHFGGPKGFGEIPVSQIASDASGKLWVSYEDRRYIGSILTTLEPVSGAMRQFSFSFIEGKTIAFMHVVDDSRVIFVLRTPNPLSADSRFWIAVLNPNTAEVKEIPFPDAHSRPTITSERDLSFAVAGRYLWLGAPGHRVFRLELQSGKITPFAYAPDLDGGRIPGLISYVVAGPTGEVWVLPFCVARRGQTVRLNRIYSIPQDGRPVKKSVFQKGAPCSFETRYVNSSLVDRSGMLWAGLSGSGLCVADLRTGLFPLINESTPDVALSDGFVKSVWKTPGGILWVATLSGLDRIDRANLSVRRYAYRHGAPGGLSDFPQRVLVSRDGTLWVGTTYAGLDRSLGAGGVFKNFRHDPRDPGSLSSNNVAALLEDTAGTLWIGTKGGGLNRLQPGSKQFLAFRHRPDDVDSIPSDFVTALLEDSTGGFWVGTEDGDLSRFDRSTGRFARTNLGVKAPVLSLAEDPAHKGVIWVGTVTHGLIRYEPSGPAVTRYTTQNSPLPSDAVFVVLSDGKTGLWAGTSQGLARIDSVSREFKLFGLHHGIQSLEFNTAAGFRAANGELFLGGVKGLNAFYPKMVLTNNTPPLAAIRTVRVMGHKGGWSLSRTVSYLKGSGSREIGSGNQDLRFDFAPLHFADPERNTCRFQLEGYDQNWRESKGRGEASYANLPPGDYRFRVRAVSSAGVWADKEAVLAFTIAKRFHQTIWFGLLLVGAVTGAVWALYRLRIRRLHSLKIKLEKTVGERTRELSSAIDVISAQATQLREVNEVKSRFLTNISHDFLTPLTVTLGTLSSLRAGEYGPIGGDAARELEQVIRNEKRLLQLANKLISIARADSGKLRLRWVECDLCQIASEVVAACIPLAREKNITLECIHDGPILVWCDRDWMHQVAANLVSNALKFTPTGGRVAVRLRCEQESGEISLCVEDNGVGIPPEDLPRIFERYYQSEFGVHASYAGIGVGLSLVKEIVELHGGEVRVTSDVLKGTTFEIRLKPGKAPPAPASVEPGEAEAAGPPDLRPQEEEEEEEAFGSQEASRDKPLIVVAEDDRELRRYLVRNLRDNYRILAAESGDEAWGTIRTEIPDLVISDVVMPGLDGLQLCREIRACPETDFIPVILLTAKTQPEQRLEGFDCGADDYVTKPFEMAEFRIRIRNILEARTRLKARGMADLALHAATAADTAPKSADAVFLHRFYEKVREHAHEADYSVERLAQDMAMSRMHLYRRLNTLLGKSPADALLEYRLERAAQLLAARAGSVSEIAYSVGFKSVSHFTRRFRDRFNRTPSEHRTSAEAKASEAQRDEDAGAGSSVSA